MGRHSSPGLSLTVVVRRPAERPSTGGEEGMQPLSPSGGLSPAGRLGSELSAGSSGEEGKGEEMGYAML